MTAIVKLILMIFMPWLLAFLLLRNRRRYLWLSFSGIFAMQTFAILPIGYMAVVATGDASKTPSAANVQLGAIYTTQYRVTNSQLHGLTGWQGVDIKAGCGSPIYAPFGGTVTYQGLDGYNHLGKYEQATMLTIKSDNLELTLLHGDYDLPVGSSVKSGDIIGKENTHGWSTGCHSHVILKENGQTLNFLDWQKANQLQVANASLADVKPLLSSAKSDYPLRISWYDPSLGGTNCDHDCSTMASGDKVQSWIGGRGGVYAAACPRSDGWHHGKRFELDGTVYECRDTGGWINCYQPGAYDPALKRQATEYYCWVDLLNNSAYGYGNLAHNWSMVR